MLIGWDKAVKDLSENDDVIARIIANYPDERMEMKNDTLHTLVRSIVGQQISVRAADAIWNRLEKACGNSINEKNLLKLNTEELRETGLSKTKSSYILNVVDANLAVAKGRFKFSLSAHNILNADYTEQNLVPMPKGHVLLSLQYQLY